MAKKRKQAWSVGDYFAIPLADGAYSVGQVVGMEPEAMNSAICALSSRRVGEDPIELLGEFAESELLAVLFVTRDLLDSGDWKVFSSSNPISFNRYIDLTAFKKVKFVGVRVIGSGVVMKLMDAYFGLYPWNGFHDPNYLDGLLISSDRKPDNVLLK